MRINSGTLSPTDYPPRYGMTEFHGEQVGIPSNGDLKQSKMHVLRQWKSRTKN